MIARWISNFSLLLLATCAAASSAGEWLQRLGEAERSDDQTITQVLEDLQDEAEEFPDEEFGFQISEALDDAREGLVPDLSEIRSRLRLYKSLEAETKPGANETASKILSRPAFRDSKSAAQSNWLSRALGRIADLFQGREPRDVAQTVGGPANVQWLFNVVLVLLGIALLFGVVMLVRHIRWRREAKGKRARARSGLLTEEEQERSLDEWLEMADRLEAEGRYREVVRCLYLAVLLRLSEARVIRFEPSDTNWEHLRRIEAANAPRGVKYRRITLLFDYIWYGEKPASARECQVMRRQYELLCDRLREAA
ncbi:MAG: DUF4129 domain-containing protein [Armatimonadetes bacterium]|nr:DUF4129 domain-containing protein [Armatimonadota bacterium]